LVGPTGRWKHLPKDIG